MRHDTTHNNGHGLLIALIICVTLVMISAVGAWVYIEHNNAAQRDRYLLQQRQLKEAELKQQKIDTCNADAAKSGSPLAGMFCDR